MEANTSLVIVGAGGHGRVVADAALARGLAVVATDRDPAKCRGELLPGVPLLPLEEAYALEAGFHVSIGQPEGRAREFAALGDRLLATITHPAAIVSPFATLGPACFVAAQAVCAPRSVLGESVIVNHGAVVDHDCIVGDFTHVAPHVALGGGVRIGARVLLGTGARVLPGLSVCDDVTIGAGAVVIAPIAEPGVYAGVPARRVK